MASKTEQKKVTKNDLIDAVYQNTNVEKRVVQQVVEDVIVEIKKFLCEGTKIEIRGFGTLEPRLRKGREGARNPRTGEIIKVAPHYTVAFRAGGDLKNAVKEIPVK